MGFERPAITNPTLQLLADILGFTGYAAACLMPITCLPEVIAVEIVNDLEAVLEQFRLMATDLAEAELEA